MNIRRILWLVLAMTIVIASSVYLWGNSLNTHKLAVRPIGNSGIYVGAQSKTFPGNHTHEDDLRAIDKYWELIRSGNAFDKNGKYEEAITAYKEAGASYPADRLFANEKLIEVYDKTHQYEKAVAVVDEILKTERLVQYGIDKYTAIRARLLAALNQAPTQASSSAE